MSFLEISGTIFLLSIQIKNSLHILGIRKNKRVYNLSPIPTNFQEHAGTFVGVPLVGIADFLPSKTVKNGVYSWTSFLFWFKAKIQRIPLQGKNVGLTYEMNKFLRNKRIFWLKELKPKLKQLHKKVCLDLPILSWRNRKIKLSDFSITIAGFFAAITVENAFAYFRRKWNEIASKLVWRKGSSYIIKLMQFCTFLSSAWRHQSIYVWMNITENYLYVKVSWWLRKKWKFNGKA